MTEHSTAPPSHDAPNVCLHFALHSTGHLDMESPHPPAEVVSLLRDMADALAAQHSLPPAPDTARLAAVLRLAAGRPGYHTITVKQLLRTASDAPET